MKTSFRSMGVLSVLALTIGSIGVSAQTSAPRLSLESINDVLHADLGQGNSVFFTRPQLATGSTLVTRPDVAILCAGPGEHPAESQGVAVDPNGFLPAFPVGLRSVPEELLQLSSFPDDAQFRSAQRIGFGDMLYPVPPNFVVVGDIQGHCVRGLVQPTPAETPACAVQPDSFTADRIANRGFEVAGQLQLQSRIIDRTPSALYYEHVVTAVGGSVSGAQLREQFPYRTGAPGQARFKDSLNIDTSWVCRASNGAQCSSAGVSDAGMGYAQLDSASLDAGSCLRIVAIRSLDRTGLTDNDFSASLHAALFYSTHDQAGGNELDISQTRLNFD